jgi:hypothetical protein
MVLLKQRSQFQCRSLAPIGHQRPCAIMLGIDLPAQDSLTRQAAVTARTGFTALSLRPWFANPSSGRDQLPAFAGTQPRVVAARDEGTSVQCDDVKMTVRLVFGKVPRTVGDTASRPGKAKGTQSR